MQEKVLIISHNVLSMTSSMGRTLSGFLKNIPSDNLAQLYFHSEVPTTNICNNYYRITDFDMIKKKRKDIGKQFQESDIQSELKSSRVDTGNEAKIYQYAKKRSSYMYIVRNILWGLKKWKNDKLINWVREFNPDIIFFASGDYVFSYKIAIEIAEICNVPIVTYICDDYYFTKRKSISPLYFINRFWYKKTIKKLLSKHKEVVAICDKIKNDYEKEFGVISDTIMTVSTLKRFDDKINGDLKVSYIGNMGYDRHLPLIEIGHALKSLTDGKVMLDTYSAENRPEIIKYLTTENGINFHGSISYEEVSKVMKNSDILIHVEDIKEENREKVRYSVSTKIADSLSCGRCLFAYGPHDVASVEYLIDNDCACVVTDRDKLKETLKELLMDENLRNKYIQKGLEIAKQNHNSEKNCDKFRKILIKVLKNEGNAN